MTSWHLIPTWHEWNMNANGVTMMWFALYVNLVTSCLACMTHMPMHGTHALHRTSVSKYLSGLACTQADPNLAKITAPHFQVLNTQNANQNMPNMIAIAYLNENFINCNENLAWGKSEPLIHLMFWYKTKGEKVAKTSFYIHFM